MTAAPYPLPLKHAPVKLSPSQQKEQTPHPWGDQVAGPKCGHHAAVLLLPPCVHAQQHSHLMHKQTHSRNTCTPRPPTWLLLGVTAAIRQQQTTSHKQAASGSETPEAGM